MKAKILVDNNTRNEWKAEWGLAVYIEYEGHKILLDAGTTHVFAENADMMGVDLSEVEWVNYGIQAYGIEPTYLPGVRWSPNMIFDVHLMISDPLRYVDNFIKAGADIITSLWQIERE